MDAGIPNANENVKSKMEKRILLELRNTDPREVRTALKKSSATRKGWWVCEWFRLG